MRVFAALGALAVYAICLLWLQWLPHYDFLATALVTCFFTASIEGKSVFLQRGLFVAFFLIVAVLIVAHQWSIGAGGRHALVGGILPWSDAEGFLSDGLRKIHGLPFTAHSTKRPLYPVVFAFVFRVTGEDLHVTVLAFALVAAALAGLAASAVLRCYGWMAAAVVAVVLVLYLRRYLFVIGTEALGFILGAIAFLFLWQSTRTDAAKLERPNLAGFVAGAFFLALGLFARAGPMLVLPFILLFSWQAFQPAARWRAVLGISSAIIAAWGINALFVSTTGPGMAFSDYPAIIYGLLHGSDFTLVFDKYPQISALPVEDRAASILSVIISEVQREPWLLPFGMLRSLAEFLFGPHGLFSLIWYTTDDRYLEVPATLIGRVANLVRSVEPYRLVDLAAMAIASLAFVIGTIVALGQTFRGFDGGAGSCTRECLLMYIVAGVIASAAFTPPWITEGGQLQAATVCFIASFTVVVFRRAHRAGKEASPVVFPTVGSSALGIVLAVVALIGSWSVLQRKPLLPPAVACLDAKNPVRLFLPSINVEVTQNDRGFNEARLSDNLSLLARHNVELAEPLAVYLKAGMGVGMLYNTCSGHVDAVIAPAERLRQLQHGWVRLKLLAIGPMSDERPTVLRLE